mgnify:CR=1 FL=1
MRDVVRVVRMVGGQLALDAPLLVGEMRRGATETSKCVWVLVWVGDWVGERV